MVAVFITPYLAIVCWLHLGSRLSFLVHWTSRLDVWNNMCPVNFSESEDLWHMTVMKIPIASTSHSSPTMSPWGACIVHWAKLSRVKSRNPREPNLSMCLHYHFEHTRVSTLRELREASRWTMGYNAMRGRDDKEEPAQAAPTAILGDPSSASR